MIGIGVRADFKEFDELIASIENAPVRFNLLVNNIVLGRSGVRQRLARELTPYPPVSTRKKRWNSERQRRKYFASNGFGRGIPSRRTGKLQNSWEITYRPLTKEGGGSISIFNTDPKSPFVIGIYQQLMHIDTGWIRLDRNPALPKIEQQLINDVSEAWLSVLGKR